MEYHVFKKPKKLKSGKTVHRWYYYYLDANGKQVQKSCKGCKNRKDAEDYIRTLPDSDAKVISVKDIAQNMFLPNSDHMDRRIQLGKPLDIETMIQFRRFIKSIIDKWGSTPIDQIDSPEVTKFLFTVNRSGSWKNLYTSVFQEIFTEAQWYGCKIAVPKFQKFRRHSKKADIFNTDELKRLFVPENFPSYELYLFFLLCLSTGLRLGEVRAVRPRQILFDQKALLVDGFCKLDGSRTTYNKTGSPDNPRFRVVLLPGFTAAKMADYITVNGILPDDFCFTINGKPIAQKYAQRSFVLAITKAGIIPNERKLVIHSLRYTYVTRMRRELPAEVVMKMVGHTTVGMTDHYTKQAVEESLAGLIGASSAVDNLFV